MALQFGSADPQNPLILSARQRTYFGGALAVLSLRRPVDENERTVLREVMAQEQVSAEVGDTLIAQSAIGLGPDGVMLNPHWDTEQRVKWLAGLTLFAMLRGAVTPSTLNERLEVPKALAVACGFTADIVALIQEKLGGAAGADSISLRAQLEQYLHPRHELDHAVQAALQKIDPARKPKRNVSRISPARYQHKLDKEWMARLEHTAGFDDLMKFFFKHYSEKIDRVINLSSAVKVGPDQFPELYATFKGCVERLGVTPEPDLYVMGGGLNAYTSGVNRKYIMLLSGTVSMCSRGELESIIGHELGHILFDHVLYLNLARVLPELLRMIPIVGGLFSAGAAWAIELLLYQWSRAAEFSCDRAGLMACQDLESCMKLEVKLAGAPLDYYQSINLEAFLRQADEFENLDSDFLTSVYKMGLGAFRTHPWTVLRAAEVKRWHDTGNYKELLQEVPEQSAPASTGDPLPPRVRPTQCPVCNKTVPGEDRFCSGCGAPVHAGRNS